MDSAGLLGCVQTHLAGASSRRRALGAQEGEHGEHAAVVVAASAQAELLEDARDVLLHGALGDHEPLGDALVRAALRHQLEHFALARRYRRERIVAATAAEQL